MVNSAKEERFEALCARTWDNRRRANHEDQPALPSRETTIKFAESSPHESEDSRMDGPLASPGSGGHRSSTAPTRHRSSTRPEVNVPKSPEAVTRLSDKTSAEIQTVEANVAAVKHLLTDMRANAAAVICHQIREAEKTGGKHAGKHAMEEGFRK